MMKKTGPNNMSFGPKVRGFFFHFFHAFLTNVFTFYICFKSMRRAAAMKTGPNDKCLALFGPSVSFFLHVLYSN